MSIFSRYVAYVKDNPNHYWFKRKIFGWGWTPVTWQGWLVIVLFVAALVNNFYRFDSVSHSASDTLRPFLIETIFLFVVLILICLIKGEKPKWMWGLPKKKDEENE